MDLRSHRKTIGISQSRLARLSGVSRFKICTYELGSAKLSPDDSGSGLPLAGGGAPIRRGSPTIAEIDGNTGNGKEIVVGGKPMFSPFAAFPPSYELTILFGAFGSLFGMLFLNRLPRLHHPLLKNKRFSLVTHDRFFVVIECSDPKYSETETRKLLEHAGSQHIELVED